MAVRERNPTAKRRQILDAAVAEFALRSYNGANTADIARRAGVSVGTVFKQFVSKEQLANAALMDCQSKYQELVTASLASAPDARSQFAALYRAMETMSQKYPHHYVFYEHHFHAPFIDTAGAAVRDELRDKINAWVLHWQQAGVLKPGPAELLRATVIGGFVRMVREISDGNLKATREKIHMMEEFAWAAIAVANPKPPKQGSAGA